MDDRLLAIALGLLAGVLAGLFGVGGGILFVPTLTLGLGLTPAPRRGDLAARDHPDRRRGHLAPAALRQRPLAAALVIIGLAAIAGVEAGVAVAETLPEHVLRRLFGALMLVVAAQIAWRAERR